jgi:outer membrane protein TolC
MPSATASSTPTLKLTLADVVVLVLQNNRTVKSAYLQRILDRRDLELAESIFTPQFTPEIRISYDRSYIDTAIDDGRANASVGANLLLPTGARISVNLVGESFGGSFSNNALRQGFSATVTQPLLQGYGVEVNTASVQTARLQEEANLLSLKNTLMSVITNAIQSYRSLLLAQEQVKIQERSLALAKRQLEETVIFVELGQRPRSDIVQAQTGVAQREVSLASARNSLGQAQLVLLRVLNLEQTLLPEAVEVPQVQQAAPLDIAPFIQTALANNPAYLQTRLAIDQGKLRLLLAQNRSQWNLNLQASVGNTLRTNATGQVNVGAAIVLSRTFGDVSLEQAVERSQVQLQQLENTLLEAKETLTVDVRNTVRSVNDNYQQLVLAQQARELAAQQLDNEREKYRLGFGNTRQIDVLRFEDDLAAAQTAELAAAIAYLNALTQLEQLVGTTLDRWNVTLEATTESK